MTTTRVSVDWLQPSLLRLFSAIRYAVFGIKPSKTNEVRVVERFIITLSVIPFPEPSISLPKVPSNDSRFSCAGRKEGRNSEFSMRLTHNSQTHCDSGSPSTSPSHDHRSSTQWKYTHHLVRVDFLIRDVISLRISPIETRTPPKPESLVRNVECFESTRRIWNSCNGTSDGCNSKRHVADNDNDYDYEDDEAGSSRTLLNSRGSNDRTLLHFCTRVKLILLVPSVLLATQE